MVPLLFGDRLLNADGDMLRHLRHGAWMLEHGEFLHTDPFSYTKGGDPFVTFEYGSQLLYALAHRCGGLAGVVVLAIAAHRGELRGPHPLPALPRGRSLPHLRWPPWPRRSSARCTGRPGPTSSPCSASCSCSTGSSRASGGPKLWWLSPMFMVWANLHGGFVFGLTLLGIYLAGSLAGVALGGRSGALGGAEPLLRARAAGGAGSRTLANPNGCALHLHIIRFFGEPFLRDNTEEFLSPDFHSVPAADAHGRAAGDHRPARASPGRPTLPRLLLLLANVAFTLQARRNIQLLAATVFPVLAIHYDAAWRRLPDWRGIRAVFERDARRGRDAPFIAGVTLVLVTLVLLQGSVLGYQLVPAQLDSGSSRWPRCSRPAPRGVEGRIFHDFIWGGYMLYAWPEQRVFIDGGTDFYGPGADAHVHGVSAVQPGWRDTLAARDIGLVLMPTKSPMVYELAQDGWQVRYCDRTAALLELDSTRMNPRDARSAIGRCADTAVVDRLGE